MKTLFFFTLFACLTFCAWCQQPKRIFDVHLHGSKDASAQLLTLQKAGVYKAALSTSWDLQNNYRNISKTPLLYGLMFPCPNGKVPYSLQLCYGKGEEWPLLSWVEQQIKEGKIDFMGEVLSQYYGISSSDSLLFAYYSLAQKYNLPVGIHTGGAGPDHGSPNFKIELGSPLLMENMLRSFPKLKVWIMHSGDQYYKETINIMQANKRVYADISVISNPDIVSVEKFSTIMQAFIEAGLEDRLMFGSDNGAIDKVIQAVEGLSFLTDKQKKKLYYQNAERFFTSKNKQ
jgi:hypothetical protein